MSALQHSPLRNFLMYALHVLLCIIDISHIKDMQCGFKLFSCPAARLLFPALHIPTWMFDVKLLLIARALSVIEVPVAWTEVPGRLARDARDLCILRANWALGRWGIPAY